MVFRVIYNRLPLQNAFLIQVYKLDTGIMYIKGEGIQMSTYWLGLSFCQRETI